MKNVSKAETKKKEQSEAAQASAVFICCLQTPYNSENVYVERTRKYTDK